MFPRFCGERRNRGYFAVTREMKRQRVGGNGLSNDARFTEG